MEEARLTPERLGQLREHFEKTDYWVDDAPGGPFALRIGEISRELDRLLAAADYADWVYITACDPGSSQLPDAENALRMRDLTAHVTSTGHPIYHGRGVGRDGQWPAEPSLLVVGLSPAAGAVLGRRYGQLAIVVGRRAEPARLLWLVTAAGRQA